MSDLVLMIGCGRMGGAIAKALVASHRVLAFDPHAAELPVGVERLSSLADAVGCGTIILAVKPQTFATIAPELAALGGPETLFLSIMAGIPLTRLADAAGANAAIVRAMPNTPAAIGHGISAAVPSPAVTPAQRAAVDRILRPTGALLWLESEGDLDAVTALSGSGPAYFFRFTEALIRAGMQEGLDGATATRLARQTFIGAARLAEAESAGLDELRRQVTSPGGTTAAGLGAMEGTIDALAGQVVRAAAARSRALAG
ncbi:pyrroline-5-carboxylate reductase [Niveispirillum sp.]|uniref:pyrroline-5-carboxylate reductase n=1 Tax=Niveispirillum sp. TaxID=1917217 RepID=UPI001B6EA6DE|nr:pyrroline-5-carboxylate reductase [Niveispirillum sp.]MBP7339594.1 pyrroline-5-carboxylate reductase [Niveispirillum sp.]